MELSLNIEAEIAALAQTLAVHGDGQRQAVKGACWALSRVTGQPAEAIYARVYQHARVLANVPPVPPPPPTVAVPPPAAQAWWGVSPPPAPMPTVAVPPPPVIAPVAPPAPEPPLGHYPGLGPIVQLPVDPPDADLSKPPVAPDPNSMALLNEAVAEAGEPLALAMDAEMLAAVDAEFEAARLHYASQPDG